MKLFIACLIFVIFVAPSNAVHFPGLCPTVTFQENFDLKEFLGTWYIQSSYPIAEDPLCDVTFSILSGTSVLYTATKVTQSKTMLKVSKALKNIGGGRLQQSWLGLITTFQYNVLATDYHSFAITYTCINMRDKHDTFIAITTRTPNPTPDVVNTARKKLADKKLSLVQLTDHRSKDCKI